MLFIGAIGDHAEPWATVLTGPAGFVQVPDERTMVIDRLPDRDDPLAGSLTEGSDVGMLAIEPQTRRRMRVNGRVRRQAGGLVVHTDQVYSNCPKYIQVRHLVSGSDDLVTPGPPQASEGLTSDQQRWIGGADTFFITTYAPGHGADMSHRGGSPGFVSVRGPRQLVWPDYVGNSMYMTLGNLELSPASGLLFLDWTYGHALHLTGQAKTDWDPKHAAAVPGAKRLIEFTVDRVVQREHASPLQWEFGEYFRHNPPTIKQIGRGVAP